MSKSDPDSAIFMEDSAEDVTRKIKKGYCPEKIVEANPIIDYARYIILPAFDNEFAIEIKTDNGTKNVMFRSYEELEKSYLSGEIHPNDLKPAVAGAINKLL